MVRFKVPETVVVQQVLEEMVLLDSEHGGYWELNPTAAEIFALLRAGHSRDEALAQLRPHYQVADTEFERDLVALVDELVGYGLLIPCD